MSNPVTRLRKSTVLAVVFVKELVLSSITVARQVITMPPLQPAIIAVPITLRTKAGATALANCVTLTPGTTSLHVSEDLKTLYVHVLHAPNPDEVTASIKQTFESRIKEIEA